MAHSLPWRPHGPVEPPLEPTPRQYVVHSMYDQPTQLPGRFGDGSHRSHGIRTSFSSVPPVASYLAPWAAHSTAEQDSTPRVHPGEGGKQVVVPHLPPVLHHPAQRVPRASSSWSTPQGFSLGPDIHTTLPIIQRPMSPSSNSTRPRQSGSVQPCPELPVTPVSHGTSGAISRGPAVSNVPISVHAVKGPIGSTGRHAGYQGSGMKLLGSRDMATNATPGIIPCPVDFKSGSVAQTEKRKASSNASRRFRDRKRENQQFVAILQLKEAENGALRQQRDHYRSERDFFRAYSSCRLPSHQIPTRPPSPPDAPSTFSPSLPAYIPSARV